LSARCPASAGACCEASGALAEATGVELPAAAALDAGVAGASSIELEAEGEPTPGGGGVTGRAVEAQPASSAAASVVAVVKSVAAAAGALVVAVAAEEDVVATVASYRVPSAARNDAVGTGRAVDGVVHHGRARCSNGHWRDVRAGALAGRR